MHPGVDSDLTDSDEDGRPASASTPAPYSAEPCRRGASACRGCRLWLSLPGACTPYLEGGGLLRSSTGWTVSGHGQPRRTVPSGFVGEEKGGEAVSFSQRSRDPGRLLFGLESLSDDVSRATSDGRRASTTPHFRSGTPCANGTAPRLAIERFSEPLHWWESEVARRERRQGFRDCDQDTAQSPVPVGRRSSRFASGFRLSPGPRRARVGGVYMPKWDWGPESYCSEASDLKPRPSPESRLHQDESAGALGGGGRWGPMETRLRKGDPSIFHISTLLGASRRPQHHNGALIMTRQSSRAWMGKHGDRLSALLSQPSKNARQADRPDRRLATSRCAGR